MPNGNRKINFNRLNNQIKSLFIIQGDTENENSNFILEKPCDVKILPSGESWQLISKGDILIGKMSSANKLLNQLEKIKNDEGLVPENIDSLTNILLKNYALNSEIKEEQKKNKETLSLVINDLQKKENDLVNETIKIQSSIMELDQRISNKITRIKADIYEAINRNRKSNIETTDKLNKIIKDCEQSITTINHMLEQKSKSINSLSFLLLIVTISMGMISYHLYNLGIFENFFENYNSIKLDQYSSINQNKETSLKTISPSNIEKKTPENSSIIENNNITSITYSNRENIIDFIRNHYQKLSNRAYYDTWENLSENFISDLNLSYSDYEDWWDSVSTIKIENITLVSENNDSAKIRVTLTYRLNNGNWISDKKPYIYLKYDLNQGKWLIDKKLSS
ncbi:hypothetical protein [Geminocystis sp.]|uniref:hypothetical protein n=1 Tax=Geminocystis sp. TaxID=2664100 RepID=UPI0035934389